MNIWVAQIRGAILQIFLGKKCPFISLLDAPSISKKTTACCHWNVNSILAHGKLSLLTAYNSTQHYDIIYISEIYLDSSIDENTLKFDGYSLIRADHPGNMKGDGVFCIMKKIYY